MRCGYTSLYMVDGRPKKHSEAVNWLGLLTDVWVRRYYGEHE